MQGAIYKCSALPLLFYARQWLWAHSIVKLPFVEQRNPQVSCALIFNQAFLSVPFTVPERI